MGGLLSTKSRSEGDWVLNHHAWSVAGLPKELDNAIYLRYEDLSPQLKQCLLFCSLFPKGTSICQAYVVPMWISEGFIHAQERSSSYDDRLEEIADGYYQELITRNLVEPTEKSGSTPYYCTMHDLLLSLCLKKNHWLSIRMSKMMLVATTAMYVDCLYDHPNQR